MNDEGALPFPSLPREEFSAGWDESRRVIHHWLGGKSRPLAELYLGAAQLLYSRAPGWTRFVSHALREIINRLPAAVCGEEKIKRHIEYGEQVEGIVTLWDRCGGLESLVERQIDLDSAGLIGVPMPVVNALQQLMRDHVDGSANNRERASTMFKALVPESPASSGQLAWIAGKWVELGKWAHGQAHDQTHCDDERDAEEIVRRFEAMEGILRGVTRPFFENREGLDALLEDTNT